MMINRCPECGSVVAISANRGYSGEYVGRVECSRGCDYFTDAKGETMSAAVAVALLNWNKGVYIHI